MFRNHLFALMFAFYFIFPINSQTCNSCEIVPDGFPCYTDEEINGWLQVYVANGCSSEATDDQITQFNNCINNIPYFFENNVNLASAKLQCGEQLIDNSGLSSDATPMDFQSLFCETLNGSNDENSIKIVSCILYEYARKFSLEKQNFQDFQCTNNSTAGSTSMKQSLPDTGSQIITQTITQGK